MDIQARIEELTAQQQALIQQQQEGAVNIQRLAGAIAILKAPNGKVKEKIEA